MDCLDIATADMFDDEADPYKCPYAQANGPYASHHLLTDYRDDIKMLPWQSFSSETKSHVHHTQID